ncbi:MAG: tetratricopeptide repeat protein [Burkholderiales bacterium]
MEPPPLPADPLLASALSGRGDSYGERERIVELDADRDWAGLLRLAEERQRRDPEGSDWGVVAGYARLRQDDYPNAVAALSRVVRRNPEDIGAWNLLGESLRLAGQPGRAAQTLERASIVGRTSYVTFFFLGQAYRDANRLDRAAAAYREAARLAPEFGQAWFELGSAQARMGEVAEALGAVEVLRKLDPALADQLSGRIRAGGR